MVCPQGPHLGTNREVAMTLSGTCQDGNGFAFAVASCEVTYSPSKGPDLSSNGPKAMARPTSPSWA